MNDATLIKRFVLGGEDAAFAVIVGRHLPEVRAACRRILSCEHDAEDVVQATFLVLALRAGEIPWQGSVRPWLRAVARRLSLDTRDRVWRHSRRERCFQNLGANLPDELHPRGLDPAREIDRRDLCRVLDDELNRLSELDRATVVLCDLEGLTHAEAADRLGLPSGSISRRLGRARTRLRHRLTVRGLALIALAVCGLAVGISTGLRSPRSDRPILSNHSVGLADPARLLARLDRRNHSTASLRADARNVGRDAVGMADRLEDVPEEVQDRSVWLALAGDLRTSATALDLAARDGVEPDLFAAARRVKESCVQCHLAFRHDKEVSGLDYRDQ